MKRLGHQVPFASPALAATVLLATAILPTIVRAGTPATVAMDVCPADADPCNVTSIIDVTDNATLDFGARAVNVTGAGQFNFGAGSGTIACGDFTASAVGQDIAFACPATGD